MTEETASNETSAACKAASTNDVIDVAVIEPVRPGSRRDCTPRAQA